jgi:hypothetical protein
LPAWPEAFAAQGRSVERWRPHAGVERIGLSAADEIALYQRFGASLHHCRS